MYLYFEICFLEHLYVIFAISFGGLAHLARVPRKLWEGDPFEGLNYFINNIGGLAHLARVLAWQARGDRFESDILHQ